MKRIDIALTGIGAVLPTGDGIDTAWRAWVHGNTGISEFSHALLRTRRIARFGRVPDDARAASRESVPFKLRRYGTEPSLWAVHAARQAIADSGIDWEAIAAERRGAFSGQGDYTFPDVGTLRSAVQAARQPCGEIDVRQMARHALYRRGTDPFISIKGLANNALALVSLSLQCRGVGCAFVQNEAAGIAALQKAMTELRAGRCDVALVVACGSYAEPFTLAQLWRRGLMGTTECPPERLVSFDADAAGTVLGEGAVALVLERRDDAIQRGARVQGCIEYARGHAGHGQRVEHAVQVAYALFADELGDSADLVAMADGRGQRELDGVEARALATSLPVDTPVSSCRSVTGVIPAAGPLLDLALASRVIAERRLPPIHGLQRPVHEGPAWVRQTDRHLPVERVLCLQQGFSNYHSAVALARAA